MFAFKIQYKGKVLNLGKDITSFEKVQQEIKKRFPLDFKIGEVTSFQTLRKKVKESRLASIKVRIEPKQSIDLKVQSSDKVIGLFRIQPQITETIKAQKTQEKPILQQTCAFNIYKKVQDQKQNQKLERQSSSLSFKSSVRSDRMKDLEQQSQKQKQKQKIPEHFKDEKQESIHSFRSQGKAKDDQQIEQAFPKRKSSVKNSQPVSRKNSGLSLNSSKRSQKSLQNVQKPVKNAIFESQKYLNQTKIQQEVKKAIGAYFAKDQIDQKNPFMILINQVAQKKVMQVLQRFKLIPKQASQEKQQTLVSSYTEQTKFPLQNLSFEIRERIKMQQKVKLGKKLSWRIEIINIGQDFPGEMELYDEESGFEIPIAQLKSGQLQEVNIGPMIFQKLGKVKKSYRIGYLDNNGSFRFLKKKFGFEVMVESEENKGILKNNFRKRLLEIAKTINNKHQIQYLIDKFRELGITEDNGHQSSNQIVLDIIRLLQEN